MKKIIVFIFLLMTIVLVNTQFVSYSYIRKQDWKHYSESVSWVFKDAIGFKNHHNDRAIYLHDDGNIYLNDSIWLGRICRKYHNYVNTIIVVIDSNKDTTAYIAR